MLKAAETAHPDSPLLDTLAGQALMVQGATQEGFAKLQKATQTDPGLWEARFALLAALVLTHQDDKAKQELSELRSARVPNWAQVGGLRRYGWALVSVGRFQEAVQTYKSASHWLSRKVMP